VRFFAPLVKPSGFLILKLATSLMPEGKRVVVKDRSLTIKGKEEKYKKKYTKDPVYFLFF
jgi:hypothetical protein